MCHLCAKYQVFAYRVSSQIKIAVFHAQIIASVGVILNGKWRNFGRTKDIQGSEPDFNITCGDVFIFV